VGGGQAKPAGEQRRTEHSFSESFNGTLRDEILDRETFDTLLDSKTLIERSRVHDNTVRLQHSPGYRPLAPEAVLATSQSNQIIV